MPLIAPVGAVPLGDLSVVWLFRIERRLTWYIACTLRRDHGDQLAAGIRHRTETDPELGSTDLMFFFKDWSRADRGPDL